MRSEFLKIFTILFSWIFCFGSSCGICEQMRQGKEGQKSTIFRVVRHADTAFDGVHSDDSVKPTEESLRQLYFYGRENAGDIDGVVSGPLARQTFSAKAVAEGVKSSGKDIPIFFMKGMKEVDLGKLKGMPKKEAAKMVRELPAYLKNSGMWTEIDEAKLPARVRENKLLSELVINCRTALHEFFEALMQIVKEDQSKGGGGKLLVFTSSGVINLWLQQFIVGFFDPSIPNCAAYTFEYEPSSGRLELSSDKYQVLESHTEISKLNKTDMLRLEGEVMPEKCVTPTPLRMVIVGKEKDAGASKEPTVEPTEWIASDEEKEDPLSDAELSMESSSVPEENPSANSFSESKELDSPKKVRRLALHQRVASLTEKSTSSELATEAQRASLRMNKSYSQGSLPSSELGRLVDFGKGITQLRSSQENIPTLTPSIH